MKGPSLIWTPATQVVGELKPVGQRPGADRGNPQVAALTAANLYPGSAGVWECQPGGWPVTNRTDAEICYILSGVAVITDDSTGEQYRIGAGDFLVFPVGWSGRWEIEQTVRKIYVLA